MSLTGIYFILGIAMFVVILWDYRKFPMTAKRLTKQSDKGLTSFAHISLESRNLAVMTFFAIFLWPLVLFWEITGARKK